MRTGFDGSSRPSMKHFSEPIMPDVSKYEVIATPSVLEDRNWTGAPSATRDTDGNIWLAYRDRTKVKRGGELIISRSEDGVSFEDVKVIRQEDFAGRKVKSIERCSLFIDPWTGLFKLYMAIDQEFRNWVIVKLDDAESPEGFDASTAQVILARSGYGSDSKSVKDPFIMTVGRQYYMFYIGNSTRCELPHLATSVDGVNWKRFEGNPIMAGTGWHEFCLRIACVMPLAQGYAIFYEGASLNDHEKIYNIRTGLAFSPDLRTFTDLTPVEPIIQSPTPGKCWAVRYMDYVMLEDRVLFYYEAARPDDAFELRVSEVKL
jgi:hypothetical protein